MQKTEWNLHKQSEVSHYMSDETHWDPVHKNPCKSVYLSSNRFSTVKENEIQILFSFFFAVKTRNRSSIFVFHFSPSGRKRNSNSLNSSSLFLDRKYKTRHTVPGTTVLCPYTSCLIIMDNGWMKKFSGYTMCVSRLKCDAILRFVYADFTSSERLSNRINLFWGFKTFVLQYSCNCNSPKNLHLS